MQCPHCQGEMRQIGYEGIVIESCDACGGEWLDHQELGKIVDRREKAFSDEEKRAIAESTTITGVNMQHYDRDLACPECHTPTSPVNYGGDTGIMIDRCEQCHGVWVDEGQLQRIQKLVEQWEDQLPQDLKQHGPKLRRVSSNVDDRLDMNYSRFGFIDSLVNGILDIADRR